ncbi:hypothetical protein HDR59_02460 [bacterium]|nr:hypothetical protein [bacterium]
MRKVSIITLSLVMLMNSGVVFSAPRKANKRRNAVNTNTTSVTTANATALEESDVQNAMEELEINEIIEGQTELGVASSKLQEKINAVKNSCSGIKKDLDSIFGLNVATTVVSGVGTLTSGGALTTGIIKSVKDKKIEENKQQSSDIKKLLEMSDEEFDQAILSGEVSNVLDGLPSTATKEDIEKKQTALQKEIDKDTKLSQTLGNVRTGLMAGSIATSAVSTGTSIASSINAKKLAEKMKSCNNAIDELKMAKSQFLSDIDDLDVEPSKSAVYTKADDILKACKGYDKDNIKQVQTMSTASAVTSGIGTATSIAGTITSAMANSKNVRNAEGDEAEKKEKNLNLASNIMAGISTGTSGASTVLSAISISKAKKDSEMAEECENILK